MGIEDGGTDIPVEDDYPVMHPMGQSMGDGVDLYAKRRALEEELRDAVSSNNELGRKKALLEAEYRKERGKAALDLRAENTPVSLIDKLVYVDETVSDLLLRRDVAEVDYKTTFEQINMLKIFIRDTEEDIKREYQQQ